jgi:tetratricopeptide (TPR) repeat protein
MISNAGGKGPRRIRSFIALILVGAAAACATRTAPPLPTTLKYPDFMFPAVPADLATAPGAERVNFGWRYLQGDDLRNADREFAEVLARAPAMYPAQAGLGYVALARKEPERAVESFDAALTAEPRYVPALVGKGQALLTLERDDEALAAFEAALAADGAKTIPEDVAGNIRRRIEVLQFRGLQQVIERARTAAAAGRGEEARAAYRRAIEASASSDRRARPWSTSAAPSSSTRKIPPR